jgi:hypothetical protein
LVADTPVIRIKRKRTWQRRIALHIAHRAGEKGNRSRRIASTHIAAAHKERGGPAQRTEIKNRLAREIGEKKRELVFQLGGFTVGTKLTPIFSQRFGR